MYVAFIVPKRFKRTFPMLYNYYIIRYVYQNIGQLWLLKVSKGIIYVTYNASYVIRDSYLEV